jgi:predicted phage terminase large subunit-like protein
MADVNVFDRIARAQIGEQEYELSQEQAVAELLRRERSQRSLAEYARSIEIPGAPLNDDTENEQFRPVETSLAAHHLLFCNKIQECIERDHGRLMIFAPPGSAKSSYASVVAVCWAMAKFPNYRVILASYASDIAEKQSRRARSLCRQEQHISIWPDAPELKTDQRAVGSWALSNGNEFMAAGLLAGITGNRADLAIIDDPVSGREDADSEPLQKKTMDAYRDDVISRLKPKASVIIIQCMTGDTPVLMADGAEKALRDLRPGDMVASLDGNRLVPQRVLNHVNQGSDNVLAIRTISGRVVRANERHPFLVDRNGAREWTKLRDLKPGDLLVGTKVVTTLQGPRGCVCHTTTKLDGPLGTGLPLSTPKRSGSGISGTDTDLNPPNMTRCLLSKAEIVRSAGTRQAQTTHDDIGKTSCASITTTQQAECAACCATIAISQSDTEKASGFCSPPLGTYGITLDQIESITPDGYEDVFDIRVEHTENFIAGGLASHNTRWNENDLSGQILPENYKGQSGPVECRDGQTWEVINLPAEAEMPDDPLGRKPGEFLWVDWFGQRHWDIRKNDPQGQRTWASLYQQRPTAGDGIEFKREWFKRYNANAEPGTPGGRPKHLTIYAASDFATKQDKGDFTEHGIWGIDEIGDLWALEWWYGQKTTDIWIAQMVMMIRKYKNLRTPIMKWYHEGGPIGNAVTPAINKAMREGQTHVVLQDMTSIQNKAVKLSSFQARAATGTVHFPADRPWADRTIDQLCAFPAGRYDDAADVCGLLARAIDEMSNAHIPSAHSKPQLIPFSVQWLLHQEQDDRQKVRYF